MVNLNALARVGRATRHGTPESRCVTLLVWDSWSSWSAMRNRKPTWACVVLASYVLATTAAWVHEGHHFDHSFAAQPVLSGGCCADAKSAESAWHAHPGLSACCDATEFRGLFSTTDGAAHHPGDCVVCRFHLLTSSTFVAAVSPAPAVVLDRWLAPKPIAARTLPFSIPDSRAPPHIA